MNLENSFASETGAGIVKMGPSVAFSLFLEWNHEIYH